MRRNQGERYEKSRGRAVWSFEKRVFNPVGRRREIQAKRPQSQWRELETEAERRSKRRTHPADPLSILIRSLASHKALHRPLDNRTPTQIPLVIFHPIFLLGLLLYQPTRTSRRRLLRSQSSSIDRSVVHRDLDGLLGSRDRLAQELLTARKTRAEVGPVSGRVEGVPPSKAKCFHISLDPSGKKLEEDRGGRKRESGEKGRRTNCYASGKRKLPGRTSRTQRAGVQPSSSDSRRRTL